MSTGGTFAQEVSRMRRHVEDLYVPHPLRYWADLTMSAGCGWFAFWTAAITAPFSWTQLLALLLAALLLYRAVCFTHELAHLARKALPGFRLAWHLLCGLPMATPHFLYRGVHSRHHGLSHFNTEDDGEYFPQSAHPTLTLLRFMVASFVSPLLSVIRFVVLVPVSYLHPRIRKWVQTYASSMCIKVNYRRPPRTSQERWAWRLEEWSSATFWTVILMLVALNWIPLTIIVTWYGLAVSTGLLNAIRVLGATHRYQGDGEPMSLFEQVEDSVNITGQPALSELLAPVGLRWHALHHLFPALPYHNLEQAHRRLCANLPDDSVYRQTACPSIGRGLAQVIRLAQRQRQPFPTH